jgi:hypothetical protein
VALRPLPAATTAPQYGAPYGAPSGGSGSFHGAGIPYGYGGGGTSTPSVFSGAPYQPAPWNPTHGGAWNQDALAQNFNTMTLQQPPPSEWYADSGAGSHMTTDAGKISTLSSPTTSTPSSIIVGNGALLPVTAIGSHTFALPSRNLVLTMSWFHHISLRT